MQCQIRKHDDHQFEVKLTYSLDRHRRRERYHLSLFIFYPYQLGLSEATYPRRPFYEDLNSYTRFKTPTFSLEELNNLDLPGNPLARVRRAIAEGVSAGAWDNHRTIYEMRMLAMVVRVHVREMTQYLHSLAKQPQATDLPTATRRFLQELGHLLATIRELRNRLLAPSVPETITQTFDLMDEYISLQVEYFLLRTARSLARMGIGEKILRADLCRTACCEAEYRAQRGWQTVVSDDDHRNEYFLYRESLLKKFCANVLFLSVNHQAGDTRVRQALSATAAGVAMTLGVTGLWVASRYWSENLAALGAVAVLIYVVRDRVKDLLRQYGGHVLSRWTYDRSASLVDRQYGQKVGVTRESLRWIGRSALSRTVCDARQYQDSLERQVAEPTECILHYCKDVNVDAKAIFESHERAIAIDEILRLHVGRWLDRMDDARKVLLKAESGEVQPAEKAARRVYHVNVIVHLSSEATGGQILQKARLILSRNGIERIEL